MALALHFDGRQMAALFPRWANPVARLVLATFAVVVVVLVAGPMIYVRTPYASDRGDPIEQPVEFDHRHHVRDDGIPCVYCHDRVETEADAGLPSTARCMGCHAQVWPDSPMLAPVRQSWTTGTPIRWRRVHDLPDHVYFHHGVHVHAGVACATCHGAVEDMARVARVAPLTMGWCLDCHRAIGGRAIGRLTTCSACHR